MEIEPWMIEAVDYYQRHEFFTAGLPERALSEALGVYEGRLGRFGHAPTPVEQLWPNRELGLLQLDEERVLYLDFEVEAVGGSTMYIATIPRIARITRGVFSAWDVHEQALDRERWGPVNLSFHVGADEHRYEVRGGNHDWIDPQILWIIDTFLHISPYRLHAAVDSLRDSQGGVFAVLSEDERSRIERERGLVFVPLPQQPSPPWEWITALDGDVP